MKEKVFVVDDSPINLTIIERGLASHFEVITISSGKKLFEELDKTTPDLILLDITMPDMDGFEVLERLKRSVIYANIPVIFLTALTDEKTEVRGFAMGVMDFVTKPFSIPILINRINTHIGVDKIMKQRTEELRQSNQSLEKLHRNLLFILADLVENRDKGTGGHVYRTIRYTEILMMGMMERGVYANEMMDWDIHNVLTSVALHDVGKIGTSDAILNKQGKLTEDEFNQMKMHSKDGADIIISVMSRIGSKRFLEDARLFAEFHHENWDGSGYPHGLSGTDIPLQGRIMAFADVYDALVSDRSYKKGIPDEEAVKIIMQDVGKKFDPMIAVVFYDLRDKFAAVHKEYSGAEQGDF